MLKGGMAMVKFGTAGNPEKFYDQGGKSSLEMPAWLESIGLDAYEYQCGRGVRITDEAAQMLGENARKHNITLSVHAPYFTNISSVEPEKIDNTIGYILQAATAAHNLGAKRLVVHMGAAKDITRRYAMEISKSTVERALYELDNAGVGDVRLCLETMGKINQMGTIEEVMELCTMDERLMPTVDFGHLNSRMQGELKTEEDFERIIKYMEKKIGRERVNDFHAHFSKIEFTKAGEKRHLTFENTEYGPEFSPLARVLAKHKLSPVIICESAGTQSDDALTMKKLYEECLK